MENSYFGLHVSRPSDTESFAGSRRSSFSAKGLIVLPAACVPTLVCSSSAHPRQTRPGSGCSDTEGMEFQNEFILRSQETPHRLAGWRVRPSPQDTGRPDYATDSGLNGLDSRRFLVIIRTKHSLGWAVLWEFRRHGGRQLS